MAENPAAASVMASVEASIPSPGQQLRNELSSLPTTSIDSALTQAEKLEIKRNEQEESDEPSAKRVKVDHSEPSAVFVPGEVDSRQTTKGTAMIKAEFVALPLIGSLTNGVIQVSH